MPQQSKRISGAPVVVNDDGYSALTRLQLTANDFKEGWLQKIIFENPAILPINEIEPIFFPAIPIGREINVTSGFIDGLFISKQGFITIVETKLWRNPEARREVVSQIMDYAKDVNKWTFEKLDGIVKQHSKNGKGVLHLLQEGSDSDDFDEKRVIDNVIRNLRLGRFLLLIVGDGIREDVEELVEYIAQSPHLQFTLALVELQVYAMNSPAGSRLVIPQVVARTKEIPRGTMRIEILANGAADVSHVVENISESEARSSNGRTTLTEIDFFEQLQRNSGLTAANFTRQIIQDFEGEFTYIEWGSSSFSIRFYDDINPQAELSILNIKATAKFNLGRSGSKFESLGLPKELSHEYARQMSLLLNVANDSRRPHLLAADTELALLMPVYPDAKRIIGNYINRLIEAVRKLPSTENIRFGR